MREFQKSAASVAILGVVAEAVALFVVIVKVVVEVEVTVPG